jgi:hypothetical protein
VPLIEIQPERFRKIRYDAPRKHKVEIEIEAFAAIDIFIVPVPEFDKWKKGSKDYGGDGFLRKKNLQLRVNIDDSPEGWYLILDNRTDSVVSVRYEVFEV